MFGGIVRQIVMAGREETEIAALCTGKRLEGELLEPQNVGHCEAEMFSLGVNLNQDTV